MPACEAARPLDVGGSKITVLASSEQAGGYGLSRIEGPEGTGPGPRHHAGDESSFVLRGAVHCGVDAAQVPAAAGDLVHVPGGCAHGFRFAPGGGEFSSITSRGDASRMFQAFDEGITWAGPDRRALVALAASHGQAVLAPPSPAAPAPAAAGPTSPASKPPGAGPTTPA